ncbi:MAG: hypothetical protein J7K51_05795 [Thermotogae bacterium]|nr:hypothetical protein [Thermotogota bacterium]
MRNLDGIVGYLSIYSYMVYPPGNRAGSLEKAAEMSYKLVKSEMKELIKRSRNYGYVLRAVAFGMETYSTIKEYAEIHFGRTTDPTLSNNLSSLAKQGFLEYHYKKSKKLYSIPDSVVKKICVQLKLK